MLCKEVSYNTKKVSKFMRSLSKTHEQYLQECHKYQFQMKVQLQDLEGVVEDHINTMKEKK